MGQQSKSEGAVLRFAKYYTPLVVLTCVLLIVVPAIMRKQDLKVHCRSAPWPAICARHGLSELFLQCCFHCAIADLQSAITDHSSKSPLICL